MTRPVQWSPPHPKQKQQIILKVIWLSTSWYCLCWGLTSQSTILQSCRDKATSSWVINQYFRGVKCLAQGHNMAAVGFKPPTSRSGVRHTTTEPPRSPKLILLSTGKLDLSQIRIHPRFNKACLPNLKCAVVKQCPPQNWCYFKILFQINVIIKFYAILVCIIYLLSHKHFTCKRNKNVPITYLFHFWRLDEDFFIKLKFYCSKLSKIIE